LKINIFTIGGVYIYGSVGNVWSRQSKVIPADGVTNDWIGNSVSIYGTAAMYGSYRDDDKGTDSGIKFTV
jgi:hypothetical protein